MTTSLDLNLYPAIYRTSIWKRSLKILGAMTLFLLYVLARMDTLDRPVAPSLLVFIILLALFLLLTSANATFVKVTLYLDRIELATLFYTKSMSRADAAKLQHRLFGAPVLISRKGLSGSIHAARERGGVACGPSLRHARFRDRSARFVPKGFAVFGMAPAPD